MKKNTNILLLFIILISCNQSKKNNKSEIKQDRKIETNEIKKNTKIDSVVERKFYKIGANHENVKNIKKDKNSKTKNHEVDNSDLTKQTPYKLDNLNSFKINNGKDTIVDLDYFTSEHFSNIIINYPKLTKSDFTHSEKINDTNILRFYNDTLSIIIKQVKYNSELHDFKEIIDKSFVLIDGKRAYGFDFGTQETEIETEIESIKIINRDRIISIPKKYYSNWFNSGLNYKNSADIFLLPNNRIIIDFIGSDGASGYRGGLIIKDNKVIKKLEFTGW